MADPHIEHPIMPTGSGVADLEIARQEDALENDTAAVLPPEQAPMDEAAGGPQARDVDLPGVTASGAE